MRCHMSSNLASSIQLRPTCEIQHFLMLNRNKALNAQCQFAPPRSVARKPPSQPEFWATTEYLHAEARTFWWKASHLRSTPQLDAWHYDCGGTSLEGAQAVTIISNALLHFYFQTMMLATLWPDCQPGNFLPCSTHTIRPFFAKCSGKKSAGVETRHFSRVSSETLRFDEPMNLR